MQNVVLTEEQIQIVVNAQQKIYDEKNWSIMYTPGCYVAALIRQQDAQLAGEYWNWHCKFELNRAAPAPFTDERVVALETLLKEYDQKLTREYRMPAWGYAGT
jgi:hypothetical protein